MTSGATNHYRRALLLAGLLLVTVPLVHGAGAHLADLASIELGIDAPTSAADLDAVEEGCVLCVAGRSVAHGETTTWRLPTPPSRPLLVRTDETSPARRARLGPDAPRAPPLRLA